MLVSALATWLTSEAEYSPPLVDASFINGMNDFDISAGHASFLDGMNDFDISAGVRVAQQPPPLGDTIFMDEMGNFDISAGVGAPQPPLGDVFANASSNFEISHQNVINSSSFENSMNNFDVSAGEVSSPIGDARFQLPVGTS